MTAPTTTPQLSIIIVNFNGGELVLEAVQRALAATLPVEVRVADNASQDGSAEQLQTLAAQHPTLRLTRHPRNLGFAAASNRELAAARGDWLLLLNPDCLLAPDTPAHLIAALTADPSAGMAGCLLLNPDGSEQRGCRRTLPTLGSSLGWGLRLERIRRQLRPHAQPLNLHQQPLPPEPHHVEAISGALMLLRRQAWQQVGPLDEGYFLHCEDLDWCRRFADHGWKILFLPNHQITHHQGTCSAARPLRVEWHKHRGMARYYRKFLATEQSALGRSIVHLGIWTRFSAVALRHLITRRRK